MRISIYFLRHQHFCHYQHRQQIDQCFLPSTTSHQPSRTPIFNEFHLHSSSCNHLLLLVPHTITLLSRFLLMSLLANTSMLHPHPQAQMVHSAARSNSMPSWRGHLPITFQPITIDQYQINTHFSQKVFLGGIPPELTEGISLTHITLHPLSLSPSLLAELLLVLRKFGKCNIKWPKNDGLNHNMPGEMTMMMVMSID